MNKKITVIFIAFLVIATGCFVVQNVFGVQFLSFVQMTATSTAERIIYLNEGKITGLSFSGASTEAIPLDVVNQSVQSAQANLPTPTQESQQFNNFYLNTLNPFCDNFFTYYNGSTFEPDEIEGLVNNQGAKLAGVESGVSALKNDGVFGAGNGSADCAAVWSDSSTITRDCEISLASSITINKDIDCGYDYFSMYSPNKLSLSGGTKNFAIAHPTKKGMELVHSVLEGPEAAVFYRGEAQLVNGEAVVKLPDYFEALTLKENRTVFLTPKVESEEEAISNLAASAVVAGKFIVKAVDNNNPSQKFFWEVEAVRADIPPLEVETEK